VSDRPQNRHLKPFAPGQSGNPNGRPKGQSLTARLRELLEQDEFQGRAIADGKCVADLLVEAIVAGALAGDTRLIQEVLDRTEGKPKQTIEQRQAVKEYVTFGPDDL
jgi:hypothetical protein